MDSNTINLAKLYEMVHEELAFYMVTDAKSVDRVACVNAITNIFIAAQLTDIAPSLNYIKEILEERLVDR